MRNHIGLSELITERDAAALKHLIDVRIEHVNDPDAKQENADAMQEDEGSGADAKPAKLGYKIIFQFSPNDFFENEILEKTYVYGQEVDYSGEFVYGNAIGTTIQWKEDKDLTKEIEIKKQRNKSARLPPTPSSFRIPFANNLFFIFSIQIPTVLGLFVKLGQLILSSISSPHQPLQAMIWKMMMISIWMNESQLTVPLVKISKKRFFFFFFTLSSYFLALQLTSILLGHSSCCGLLHRKSSGVRNR